MIISAPLPLSMALFISWGESFVKHNFALDERFSFRHSTRMKLDEYIRKHRIKASDFAAAVGLSQGSISRIRRGTQMPSLEAAVAIERETNGKVKPKDFSSN